MIYQEKIQIQTQGRGFYNLTQQLKTIVKNSAIIQGLCHIYIHHTSASIIITENLDQKVLTDLASYISRLVVDGDAIFEHVEEGIDDMSAHIRSVLTQTSISIPINNILDLGPWQGVFLWEHRFKAYQRNLTVSILN